MDTQTPRVKDVREVLAEVEAYAASARQGQTGEPPTIKDLRRSFDQESSRLNQAIFNDQPQEVRESVLRTIAALLEILARS